MEKGDVCVLRTLILHPLAVVIVAPVPPMEPPMTIVYVGLISEVVADPVVVSDEVAVLVE